MNDIEIDNLNASDLLKPRKNLPWKAGKLQLHYWARPFFIENRVTKAHTEKVLMAEQKERALLRDVIDGELARLTAAKYRFWIAEWRFLEKLMAFRQLAVYASGFLSLSRIMPRKLVFCRRMVVRKYLKRHSLPQTAFITKLCRQFVRFSVLLYPAEKLMAAADRFICLARRSADQSTAANRRRVAMLLRSLRLMSDRDICDQFQCEEEYLEELALLGDLARHYRLSVDEVFRISASEISRFWELQR